MSGQSVVPAPSIELTSEMAEKEDMFSDMMARLRDSLLRQACSVFAVATAEDLVQQALAEAVKSYRGTTKPSLAEVEAGVRRRIWQRVKDERRRRQRAMCEEDIEAHAETLISRDMPADERLEYEELKAVVKRELRRVGPPADKIFWLALFEYLTRKQIAERLELTEENVKEGMRKASDNVKKAVIKYRNCQPNHLRRPTDDR